MINMQKIIEGLQMYVDAVNNMTLEERFEFVFKYILKNDLNQGKIENLLKDIKSGNK